MTTRRRLIQILPFPGGEVRIHTQSEWERYRVSVWLTAKIHLIASDYFTDDKIDATSTAEAMQRQYERNARNNPWDTGSCAT